MNLPARGQRSDAQAARAGFSAPCSACTRRASAVALQSSENRGVSSSPLEIAAWSPLERGRAPAQTEARISSRFSGVISFQP